MSQAGIFIGRYVLKINTEKITNGQIIVKYLHLGRS